MSGLVLASCQLLQRMPAASRAFQHSVCFQQPLAGLGPATDTPDQDEEPICHNKDGNANQATFMAPELMAADSAGNLYSTDQLYVNYICCVLRRITAPATPISHVTSFPGKGQFRELISVEEGEVGFHSRVITALACHSKYLFIAHGTEEACTCGVWRVDLTTNQVENIVGGECPPKCKCHTKPRLSFCPTAMACSSSSGTVHWQGQVKSIVVLPDESLLMARADNTILWATPLSEIQRVADGRVDANNEVEEEKEDNQMVDAVGLEARFVDVGHMAFDAVRGVVYVADRHCIRTITLPLTCLPPKSSFAWDMPSLHTSLAAFPGVALFDVGGEEYFRGLLAHHREDATVSLAHNSSKAFKVVLIYLHLDSIPADLSEDIFLTIELLEFVKRALLPHLGYLCESQIVKATSNHQVGRSGSLGILPAAKKLGLRRL
eukprot:jgi/Chlat1/5544/Chrsp369S05398